MKGYHTQSGYMGYVPSEKCYMLFASEADYIDYITWPKGGRKPSRQPPK